MDVRDGIRVVSLESEYTQLASKLELVILFALFYPLLIPIMAVALFVNARVYTYAVMHKHWKVHYHYRFAFHVLLVSIVAEQALLLCFVWHLFHSALIWVLLCAFACMDVLFVLRHRIMHMVKAFI